MQLQFEVKTNKKLCDCSLKLKQQQNYTITVWNKYKQQQKTFDNFVS